MPSLTVMEDAQLGRTQRNHARLFLLSGVVLLGLIVRIIAWRSFSPTGYFDVLVIDEEYYHRWALDIAASSDASRLPFKVSPLFAYLIAFIYKCVSPDPLYVRMLNVALGSMLCGTIFLLGEHIGNRWVGLGAGLLGALYKPFVLYSIVPLKTMLEVLLFCLTAYALVQTITSRRLWRVLLLGLVVGLLILARENTLAFVPLIATILIYNERRNEARLKRYAMVTALFVTGAVLILVPSAIHNYRASGDFTLTTHQAGFNLYIANRLDNPTPYYRPVAFASSNPGDLEIHFRIEASRRVGRSLSGHEAELYWLKQIAEIAFADPIAFLSKQGYKILALLSSAEAGDHYDPNFLSLFVPFFKLPLPGFAVVMPFALSGLVLARPFSRPRTAVVLLCLVYALTMIPFHINGRYRLPLVAPLLPFCFIGIERFLSTVRAGRLAESTVYALFLLSFIGVAFYPVPGSQDRTAYINVHAWMLSRHAKKKEAQSFWEQSSAMNGTYSAFANIALARSSLSERDYERALRYVDKIEDDSFAASTKQELLGDVLLGQGRLSEACAAYERSLEINFGKLHVRRKLIAVLSVLDKERAARQSQVLDSLISQYYRGL